MQYNDFKKTLSECGLTVEDLAFYLNFSPATLTCYAKIGEVPQNLSLLAFALKEWWQQDPEFRNKLLRFKIQSEQVQFEFPFFAGLNSKLVKEEFPEHALLYPKLKFIGSQYRHLRKIFEVSKKINFSSVLDLFSGSAATAYLFKAMGKQVVCNDFMEFAHIAARALIVNNGSQLSVSEVQSIFDSGFENDHFVEKTFKDLYFLEEDNKQIDIIRTGIFQMENDFKRDIALLALVRACLKKRIKGTFRYTGMEEIRKSHSKEIRVPFKELFAKSVEDINKAVFNNDRHNLAYREDGITFDGPKCDLVYINPPSYIVNSREQDYSGHYHFVEGLVCNWEGLNIKEKSKTKKFPTYPTPFMNKKKVYGAFELLFEKYKGTPILISYSVNGLPSVPELVGALERNDKKIEIFTYSESDGLQQSGKGADEKESRRKEVLLLAY